jgi:hypothetical protein
VPLDALHDHLLVADLAALQQRRDVPEEERRRAWSQTMEPRTLSSCRRSAWGSGGSGLAVSQATLIGWPVLNRDTYGHRAVIRIMMLGFSHAYDGDLRK